MGTTLPLLEYKPTTQDQRVQSFGKADLNEDSPYLYRIEDSSTRTEIDTLIWATYRQVFNEQETLQFNRQITLETQLKNRSITVRDFIRGLAKSERFYRLVVEANNNYRLVEVCLKRLLGRSPYNKEETIAWSIQVATLGWSKFVDALIDSAEYSEAFGDNTVPYQRKRVTERPYSFTPRYGADYRDRLPKQGELKFVQPFKPQFEQFERFNWEKFVRTSDWKTVTAVSVSTLGLIFFLLLFFAVNGSIG
ncbi:phycobilisome rod-core linker polypeptide [Cyanobacteria bacterium FACHB-DQ100]|uniref:phycobilisome rod-core linker polypeptide n=1 Tax=Leptolyngbya sp. DQ-M1 TaxID=2933920 RepID=UPI0019956B93|nr:phycobilisome rod-core linker polypeptide [Cyanobacteria bacterium FACHB-DQ100]